jgi:hypothetical protein
VTTPSVFPFLLAWVISCAQSVSPGKVANNPAPASPVRREMVFSCECAELSGEPNVPPTTRIDVCQPASCSEEEVCRDVALAGGRPCRPVGRAHRPAVWHDELLCKGTQAPLVCSAPDRRTGHAATPKAQGVEVVTPSGCLGAYVKGARAMCAACPVCQAADSCKSDGRPCRRAISNDGCTIVIDRGWSMEVIVERSQLHRMESCPDRPIAP